MLRKQEEGRHSLRQSTYHPSLWFVVRAPCLSALRKVRLPDDGDLPDIAACGEHKHAAALLVYVDDFLAAGPRDVLQPLLVPDYLMFGKAVIQTSQA